MRWVLAICMMMTLSSCTDSETESKEFPHGLYVENGLFMLKGKPYYGVGANYFDMFTRDVEMGTDSGLTGLMELRRAKVPFVRFAASSYGPNGWHEHYFKDKKVYYEVFDKYVDKAEKLGIGLIPSLFWHVPTFPDIFCEHMDQYDNPESKTINFIRDYTKEVVERYKDSPAIWGWEFGNEYSLQIDIPHKYIPDVLPGSPPQRDPIRDELTQAGMLLAFKTFAETIREIDKTRPIISGNDSPRGSAYHNTHNGPEDDWQPDSEKEYRYMVALYEKSMNTITTRGYYNYGEKAKNYALGLVEFSDFIGWLMPVAKEMGKPVFVGEFGALPQWLEDSKHWKRYDDLAVAWQERFDAIVKNRVQLSAFWNYDYFFSSEADRFHIGNDPLGVLDMLQKANEKLKQ